MNRSKRRKALRGSQPGFRPGFRQPPKSNEPIIKKFDPTTMYRLRYDIAVPGGPLRSDHPSQNAGTLEAASEADLLRGIIVKLLDCYAFTPHDRAVSGVLAEVFNPLPKRLRGAIAYNIIEGLGLALVEDEEDVCDDEKCGAIREQGIHPDPPADTPEEDLPLMIDITSHAPECHVNREVEAEHPERSLRPATYKREPVVSVHNPRHYEPLTNKAIDPETGDVITPLEVPETGGVSDDEVQSTVDADAGEEAFVVTEEDDGRTGEAAGSATAGNAESSEPGTDSPETPGGSD